MASDDIQTDIAFAEQLADAAGAIARRYFRTDHGLTTKDDLSLVTLADREIEQKLRDMIGYEHPEDGVWGEEFGVTASQSGRQWIIDPIDGTTEFAIGRPLFATLIALQQDNEFVLGLIDQPIAKERWIGAKETPTRFNGKIVKTKNTTQLPDALMASTSPTMFTGDDAVALQLGKKACKHIWGGDAYNYGLLAAGHIDLVVESHLKLHDYATHVAVIENAGGVITDWQGDKLTVTSDGRVIAASTKELHQTAIKFLNNK